MDNRDFDRSKVLSKKDIIILINYISGAGLLEEELELNSNDSGFNKLKNFQLEKTQKHVETINVLSAKEAYDYFLKVPIKSIYKAIEQEIQYDEIDIKQLNNKKDKFIDAIAQNKDFSEEIIEWIKSQKIEVIYYLYNKTQLKNNIRKTLKPLKNFSNTKHLQSFVSSKSVKDFLEEIVRDYKIKIIIGVKAPYVELSEKQQELRNQLLNLEEKKHGTIDNFFKSAITNNEKEMNEIEFLDKDSRKGIPKYTGSNYEDEDYDWLHEGTEPDFESEELIPERSPENLITDISDDILKNSDLLNYFESFELENVITQNVAISRRQFDLAPQPFNIDDEREEEIFDNLLQIFGLNKETIDDLNQEYVNEDLIKKNIALNNLYSIIRKKFTAKIEKRMPNELKSIKVADEEYSQCLITTKLFKGGFAIDNYKFLYDNIKYIDINILYMIFNNYSSNTVSTIINNLRILSDNKNVLSNLQDAELLDFYFNFNHEYFMTDEQRQYFKTNKFIPKSEYREVLPEAFIKIDNFIKKLK